MKKILELFKKEGIWEIKKLLAFPGDFAIRKLKSKSTGIILNKKEMLKLSKEIKALAEGDND